MQNAPVSIFCCFILVFLSDEISAKTNGVENKMISIGMNVKEALAILKGIQAEVNQVDFGDVVLRDDEGSWKKYVVKPLYESNDALVLLAKMEEKPGDYKIRNIYWHIKYDEDTTLPKSQRALRMLHLQSVDPGVLKPNENKKRLLPDQPTNPFR